MVCHGEFGIQSTRLWGFVKLSEIDNIVNTYYRIKHELKIIRWRFRRNAAALHWGRSELETMPAVLGNAMPKSGSHLIIQVLHGLTSLGPFVKTGFPPVNRSEDNQKLPQEDVLENIRSMLQGDIAYGYIHACEPYIEALTGPHKATIFVYRDPRDMIVSHVFYATEMHKGHGMHPYYTEVLDSTEKRIDAQILGVEEPGFELSCVKTKYEAYLGWLAQPNVLCIRFEDLILNRVEVLGVILDYLAQLGFTPSVTRREAIETLTSAIAPRKSGTFRKGKPGNWREHFSQENINHFKEATGDLLVRLGYEQNADWV